MKQNKFSLFLLGLLCAIGMAFSSCKGKTSDADLQTAFATKASADARLTGISATANNGVVTLTGQCPDESCRSYAEQTAKEIKGVKSVVNNITVAPPAAPVEVSTDTALQAGVRDATKDYPGVTATVNNGEVTLTGTIQRDRLTGLMQSINGLNPRKVNNNLTVQ